MANQSPEKVFRIGGCSAAVFRNVLEPRNEGETARTVRTVSLQRRYQANGEWKTSTSFMLADLPAAIRVLDLALRHVESCEAETSRASAADAEF